MYCDLVSRAIIDGLSASQTASGVDLGEAEVLPDLRPAEEIAASQPAA
jgi:small subunit ribosomal protein S2